MYIHKANYFYDLTFVKTESKHTSHIGQLNFYSRNVIFTAYKKCCSQKQNKKKLYILNKGSMGLNDNKMKYLEILLLIIISCANGNKNTHQLCLCDSELSNHILQF